MDSSPRRGFFGPRWWLLSSILYAAFALAFSPVTVWTYTLAVVGGAMGGSTDWRPIAFLLVLFHVAVPGAAAAAAASAIQALLLKFGKLDRTKRWGWRPVVCAIVVILPAIALPSIGKWILEADLKASEPERLALARWNARPIVPSDTAGFCSVPEWRVVDGRPEVKIAIRAPSAGKYYLSVSGYDRARQGRSSSVRKDLPAGVDTFVVRLEPQEQATDSVAWPFDVQIVQLLGENRNGSGQIDVRVGTPLYVIDRNGHVSIPPR